MFLVPRNLENMRFVCIVCLCAAQPTAIKLALSLIAALSTWFMPRNRFLPHSASPLHPSPDFRVVANFMHAHQSLSAAEAALLGSSYDATTEQQSNQDQTLWPLTSNQVFL